MGKEREERLRKWFLELCPEAMTQLHCMMTDPTVPASARVSLIGIVLERALGKTETPIRVTSVQENIEEAEARIMQMVQEIMEEEGMIENDGLLTEGAGTDEDDVPVSGDHRKDGGVPGYDEDARGMDPGDGIRE